MPSLCVDGRMIEAAGIGTYLQQLLVRLAPHFSLTVLGDPAVIGRYLTCPVIPVAAPIYSLAEPWAVARKVPSCDLFWSPHFNTPWLPVRARTRVVTFHDAYHLAFARDLSLAQRLYTKTFLPWGVGRADAVITVSHFSKGEIVRFFPHLANKITVIHNGVDDLGEPCVAPSPYILSVGSVKPHKNLPCLLRAFAKFSMTHPECRLVLVGKKEGMLRCDGEALDLVDKDPRLAGKVTWTGYVDKDTLHTLYRQASLFVFPSYYEGFGLPPLEAMAAGCPVLCSDAASLPEVCGEAAVYFDPHDVEGLSCAMQKILSNTPLLESLRERGKAHAAQFSWETSFQRHFGVFSSLLAAK